MRSQNKIAAAPRSPGVSEKGTPIPEPSPSAGAPKGRATKPRAFKVEHLKEAIARGDIVAEYQPKVPFDPTLDSYGVEVLCRLRHPAFGKVYPDLFIQLAEKNGLIAELTDVVVRQAFSDWRKWHEHGLTMRLAINVSPELLDGSAWSDRFLECCAEFAIPTDYITLEITESSSKAASESAVDILARLKLKGITLSIDDFGTGFSSLATLYRLPFGELKIDKCFVMEIERDPAARALVESTVEMARRLGLKVTAEGVETDSTFAQLRLIGCDDAQGWFISKSLPPPRFRPSSQNGRKRAAYPEAAIRVLPRSSRPSRACSTKPRCRATATRR
jgi:EAL domain-containing protein (putative c-di-GMP-specific phosphodiesterase class I)